MTDDRRENRLNKQSQYDATPRELQQIQEMMKISAGRKCGECDKALGKYLYRQEAAGGKCNSHVGGKRGLAKRKAAAPDGCEGKRYQNRKEKGD